MASEWYVFLYGVFTRMSDWEERALEDAVAVPNNVVTYVWSFGEGDNVQHINYEIDLVQMTQTNMDNGTSRKLIRLGDAESHALTSPLKR